MGMREVVQFGGFRWRQDLPAVVQTPSSCQWVIQSSQSSPLFQTWFPFSSTDNLPELLLQSLRSRNVAILDPSRSLLQSCGDRLFPCSSSPVSALYVLRRRSLLPSTTRFSNRTDLASNSSVPPIGHPTSNQSDRDEYSFLDGSIKVPRGLLDVLSILAAIVPVVCGSLLQRSPNADEPVPRTWQRVGWDLLR